MAALGQSAVVVTGLIAVGGPMDQTNTPVYPASPLSTAGDRGGAGREVARADGRFVHPCEEHGQ